MKPTAAGEEPGRSTVGIAGIVVAGLVLLVARLVAGYEVPDPAHALLIMSLEGVLLLTMSLFGSTLMPTLANGFFFSIMSASQPILRIVRHTPFSSGKVLKRLTTASTKSQR